MYLLGTAVPEGSQERAPAIIKIEKTPYEPGEAVALTSPDAWSRLQMVRSRSTALLFFSTDSLNWNRKPATTSTRRRLLGSLPVARLRMFN